jgi:hypothetical protein
MVMVKGQGHRIDMALDLDLDTDTEQDDVVVVSSRRIWPYTPFSGWSSSFKILSFSLSLSLLTWRVALHPANEWRGTDEIDEKPKMMQHTPNVRHAVHIHMWWLFSLSLSLFHATIESLSPLISCTQLLPQG